MNFEMRERCQQINGEHDSIELDYVLLITPLKAFIILTHINRRLRCLELRFHEDGIDLYLRGGRGQYMKCLCCEYMYDLYIFPFQTPHNIN